MADYPFKEAFEAAGLRVVMNPGVRRERIATAALTGLLAADAGERSNALQSHWCWCQNEAAATAVELADALIAALDAPRKDKP